MNIKKFLLFTVVCSLLFFKVVTSQINSLSSNVVFETGFEEGNKNIWNDYDGNPDWENEIISDPGPFNKSGNHVIRLKTAVGERSGSDMIKVLPGEYDSLYVRWYIKYEKNFDFTALNHGGGLFGGDRNYLGMSDNRPKGNDFIYCSMEYNTEHTIPQLYMYYRGMYQDCANPNGACWGDHFPCLNGSNYCTKPEHLNTPMPPKLKDDTWYCIEMFVKMGKPSTDGKGSDGEVAMWVNGENYGHWKNLWMRTTDKLKLNLLCISLFQHNGAKSNAFVLYDDIVVTEKRIGCNPVSTDYINLFEPDDEPYIYPNPTKSSLTVKLKDNEAYLITITDSYGVQKNMWTISDNQMNTFDVSLLSGGIYYIMIRKKSNSKQSYYKKIILQ